MTDSRDQFDDRTRASGEGASGDSASGGSASGGGLPPALQRDLEALYEPRLIIAPRLDERIRAEAQRRFAAIAAERAGAGRAHRRAWVWPLSTAAGLAAAVALAVLLRISVPAHDAMQSPAAPPAREPGLAAAVPADIDRSGAVDILDAFTLARRIEAGEAISLQWDLNGDGRVDQLDVDAVAHQAVRLPDVNGGSRS